MIEDVISCNVGNAGVLLLGRPGLRTSCDNNTVHAVDVMVYQQCRITLLSACMHMHIFADVFPGDSRREPVLGFLSSVQA